MPLWLITDDHQLKDIIVNLGELLTKTAESEEESFVSEVLNVANEIEPESVESLMGESYLVFKLSLITEKFLNGNGDLKEKQRTSRRISKVLRGYGCFIKRVKGERYVHIRKR